MIVNDGSRDETGALAEQAARENDWIEVRHKPVGIRRVGPGVVDAFYSGLEGFDLNDYDYICKLDGDLDFAPTYFQDCLDYFSQDPLLGTISGKCSVKTDNKLVPERTGDQFSHGVAKLYRRECFVEIGGFVPEVMWDGIDCHQCRIHGWRARSVDDPALCIVHLRLMGSSHQSVYHGRRRWGRGQYFMGTHPLYLLFICMYRMAERPWILGGLNIAIGYFQAMLSRARRYNALGFQTYLRSWQINEIRRRFGLRIRAFT